MERRCRGDPGKNEISASSSAERKQPGQSQTGGIKRLRESEPAECVKKKKVEEWNESSVKSEPVDTFNQCDELIDEFMADMVTNDMVSRPETPASCASGDTNNSDVSQTKKSSKIKKKTSLEGKRKAATTISNKAVTDQSVTEPRSKKTRTQTAGINQIYLELKINILWRKVILTVLKHSVFKISNFVIAVFIFNQILSFSVETLQLHETPTLYYVGCKNDVLPNVDDHLDEVAALQRGVEVSVLSVWVSLL